MSKGIDLFVLFLVTVCGSQNNLMKKKSNNFFPGSEMFKY